MERNVCRCEGPDLAKDEVKHLKSEGKTVLIQKGFEDVVLTSYRRWNVQEIVYLNIYWECIEV